LDRETDERELRNARETGVFTPSSYKTAHSPWLQLQKRNAHLEVHLLRPNASITGIKRESRRSEVELLPDKGANCLVVLFAVVTVQFLQQPRDVQYM
jgi:hypothetical protein